MTYTIDQSQELVTVRCAEIEIGFSREDGGLRVLGLVGGQNLAGHGNPRPSVDVRLGERGWLADSAFVRYLGHNVTERDDATEIMITVGIGPIIVYDRYRVTGTLIARRVTLQNVGEDEVRLRGVRMALPWVRSGGLDTARFDAPGNSVRPHVPLAVAAELRRDVLPRRFFAPGIRDGRALEPAPTFAAGLLAVHDEAGDESLLCWYHSAVEPARPEVEGNGRALTLAHQVELADWLRSDVALSADAQYILLLREPWREALAAFQRTWALAAGSPPPDAPPRAVWVRDAAIYEVHPGRCGGFRALTDTLPRLADLGISTICLLPIWDYGAPPGQLWDEGRAAGHPYAPQSLTQIDQALGTPEDLRALVCRAHAVGVRVLLDLPLAGVAPDSPMVREHPAWFCVDERGSPARTHGEGGWVAFDWAHRGLQEYALGWATGLMRAYELDGFRITPPRTPPPNWARGLPYHASASTLAYLGLAERLRVAIRAVRSDAALLGALGGPVCTQRQDFAVDELPHHMLFHLGLARISPADLAEWLTDHWGALPPDTVRVCYTESYHTRDLNPLADGMRGSRISRMLLAAVVLCGFVPMIMGGQEEGDEPFIAALLRARAASDPLRLGAVSFGEITCNSRQVLAVLRTLEGRSVIGLLNTGAHRQTVTVQVPAHVAPAAGELAIVDLLSGARWREAGRDTWSPAALQGLQLTLEPFGAYCLELLPAPEPSASQAPPALGALAP
ncbi:MAG: hypothetical protein RLZZ387_4434 [Chloroflexota bacterium]